MDTHIHVVQPFQAPAVQPDRRRRERDAAPFELEAAEPKEPVAAIEPLAHAVRSLNEEGVGETVDFTA